MKNKLSVILLLVIAVAAGGCKVNYSLTGASIPENVNTVSIELFENQAALTNPNFPQRLTEALRDKFIQQTRLKVVNGDADVSFTGMIVSYGTTPVAISGNEQASLTRLTIGISVSFENRQDEEQNFNQSFSRFADFDASQTLSNVEDALMTEISNQLVQDVFNRAFLNW